MFAPSEAATARKMIDQPVITATQSLAAPWKEQLAALTRFRPFRWAMVAGVGMAVPRQRVGAALVAFNAKGEVLLLRHTFHPGVPWGLPGGWMGRNESPAEGLARELFEETGLRATIGPPVLVTHRKRPSCLTLAFLGSVEPGPATLSMEILELRWFPPGETPQPERPFTRQAIDAARNVMAGTSAPVAPLATAPDLGDNR